MNVEPDSDPTCQVCGRRLLPGERPTDYVTPDGAQVVVCELCRPRAEAAGWLRPDEAEALRASGGGSRERRRPRGQMLGGLLGRLPTGTDGEAAAVAASEAAPRGSRRLPPGSGSRARGGGEPAGERHLESAPDLGVEGPGTTLEEALVAFNASNHRRTVAGLTRTLGSPRANGLAVEVRSGHPGVRLTVAWELTWYQWEVGPGEREPEVRESGKGETIGQLRAADRAWNLMVDSDGTLAQRSAAVAPEGMA